MASDKDETKQTKRTKAAAKKTTKKTTSKAAKTAAKPVAKRTAPKTATTKAVGAKPAGAATKKAVSKRATESAAAARQTKAAGKKSTTAKPARKATTMRRTASTPATSAPGADPRAAERVVDKVAFAAPSAAAPVSSNQYPAPPERPPAVYTAPSEIPQSYGTTHIELMVKDPHWLFAYWEVTEDSWEQAREVMREVWRDTQPILRVFDVSDGGAKFFDIEITPESGNWYIRVGEPNRPFNVAIGLRGPGGVFYELARSGTVTTPSDSVSDVVEEQWARADEHYEELFRTVETHRQAAGSMDFQELMRQRMEAEVSSGAVSSWLFSMGSPALQERARERGFWFVVNTELILYGATEPDARVTVQGRPVALRPDGTFTLRFALPDGRQEIPCTATSADGIEKRTIAPQVSKTTETPQPVIDREAERAFHADGGN